jgi:hypothetical protein
MDVRKIDPWLLRAPPVTSIVCWKAKPLPFTLLPALSVMKGQCFLLQTFKTLKCFSF